MIRPAEERDVPELVGMLLAFQQEAGCYAHIDPDQDSLQRFLFRMLKRPEVAPIAIYEWEGKIAGSTAIVCERSWFNEQQIAGQELWWYIRPEYRGRHGIAMRLFKWLEHWANMHGLQSLMVCSTGTLNVERIGEFYTRRGFVKADVCYIKRVR